MNTNALQIQPAQVPQAITAGLKAHMPNLYKLLPPDVEGETFRAAVWLYLTNPPKGLLDADPRQIVAGCIEAATDGLLLGRECYILPFKSRRNNRTDAAYVRHYRGDIKTLERTGQVKRIFAQPVYSRDTFEVDMLKAPSHKVYIGRDRGNVLCYYAYIERLSGAWDMEIMTTDAIDQVRQRAPGRDQDPWTQHYDEMARKTVLKRLIKRQAWIPAALMQRLDTEDDGLEPAPITARKQAQTTADLFGDRTSAARSDDPSVVEATWTAQDTPDTGEAITKGQVEAIVQACADRNIPVDALWQWVQAEYDVPTWLDLSLRAGQHLEGWVRGEPDQVRAKLTEAGLLTA